MGLMKKAKKARSKSHQGSLLHNIREKGIAKSNIGGLSVGASLLTYNQKDGDGGGLIKKAHDSYKKTLNRVSGKEAGKATEYEQKLQKEAIGRQQQIEQLRSAEATSDLQKRKLLLRNGGNQSLMRTLG